MIGWWVWRRSPNTPINLRPLAYVALGLGIVATLASDGPLYRYLDSGIMQICQLGTQLVTTTQTQPKAELIGTPSSDPDNSNNWKITTRTNVFTSDDSGMTWHHTIEENYVESQGNCSQKDLAIDLDNSSIQYRWKSGGPIERSIDDGRTWKLDNELVEMQQDIRLYYNHYSDGGGGLSEYQRSFTLGPVGGIVDQITGNLILAMSWDGVLVRTPDGVWQWVNVGNDYKLAQVGGYVDFASVLFMELWLTAALSFLIVTTSTLYIRHKVANYSRIIAIIVVCQY